jgi:hypothetical protein
MLSNFGKAEHFCDQINIPKDPTDAIWKVSKYFATRFDTLFHIINTYLRRSVEQLIPGNLTFTDVGHLPIVKQFAKQINLLDTGTQAIFSQLSQNAVQRFGIDSRKVHFDTPCLCCRQRISKAGFGFADVDKYIERHRKEMAIKNGCNTTFSTKDFKFADDQSYSICPAGKQLYGNGGTYTEGGHRVRFQGPN